MKKSVVSALTTALVVGATATTFAAANPFSDVPAGHWAYQSVTKLAQEGVIEGYGDGTFLGNRNITRYEMAQMIAKAMAKNPQGASKAELDRLAAEFREELDNLGVRVEKLEKNSDKVKWTGEIRYRYYNDHRDNTDGSETKRMRSQMQFRIFPTAEVNENWNIKARFTSTLNFRDDSTGDAELTYIYAEGKYKNFNVNLGKMPLVSKADSASNGSMLLDAFFSGLQLTFGDKYKAQLEGGRWRGSFSDPADYLGLELLYNDKKKFHIGAGYRYFKTESFMTRNGYSKDGEDDKANIVSVGAGYNFGNVKLDAAYAKNTKADKYGKGYNVELTYQGANRNKPGSWGAFVAYRYLGSNVGFAPTWDSYGFGTTNKKGVDFGVNWSPLKNTFTKLSYFHGKTLDDNQTTKALFARVSYFF